MTLGMILGEIVAERLRQNGAWGEPDPGYPVDGTGPEVEWLDDEGIYAYDGRVITRAQDLADHFRVVCDRLSAEGALTWRAVLVEEVAEVFAEDDAVKLREELVQVAAVCVKWVQALDLRGGVC